MDLCPEKSEREWHSDNINTAGHQGRGNENHNERPLESTRMGLITETDNAKSVNTEARMWGNQNLYTLPVARPLWKTLV